MALTVEQEQALTDLLRRLPVASASTPSPAPDLLQTWLGVSGADLGATLQALLARKAHIETRVLDWAERNPFEAAVQFLAAAAWAFYRAEEHANPRIATYTDAFYYIATCASVGYADIFAVTQTGRAIAALVMIIGPALTNRLLDRPRRA